MAHSLSVSCKGSCPHLDYVAVRSVCCLQPLTLVLRNDWIEEWWKLPLTGYNTQTYTSTLVLGVCTPLKSMHVHSTAAYFAKLKNTLFLSGLAWHTHTLSHHNANDILSITCRYDWGAKLCRFSPVQCLTYWREMFLPKCGAICFVFEYLQHEGFLKIYVISRLKCYAEEIFYHQVSLTFLQHSYFVVEMKQTLFNVLCNKIVW